MDYPQSDSDLTVMPVSTSSRNLGKGFVDLPGEVRSGVYKLITSDHCTICWFGADDHPHLKSLDVTAAYCVPVCNMCTTKRGQWNSLMRTCKLIYQELNDLIYSNRMIHLNHVGMIKQMKSTIRPETLSKIQKINIHLFADRNSIGTNLTTRSKKGVKEALKEMASTLCGLKEIYFHFDIPEDVGVEADVDGPALIDWKINTLRMVLRFLKESRHLSKTYTSPSGFRYMLAVRLVTADKLPKAKESESDIDAEYQKWLDKCRERRAERKAAKEAKEAEEAEEATEAVDV